MRRGSRRSPPPPCACSTTSSTSRTIPLPGRRTEAKAKRRIGLGVTGLADALILCGARYGRRSGGAGRRAGWPPSSAAAYAASAELAREKGAFPLYDGEHFLAAPSVRRLPEEVREAIAQHGIRNGLLTSIAPTGTISLLAGNVSSGIEPVFDFRYERRVLERDGSAAHRDGRGLRARPLPPDVRRRRAADAGLRHGGGAHPPRASGDAGGAAGHVDSSISKTINCPAGISFEAFKNVYLEAYDLGLKGCTTYRPNAVTGAVLTRTAEPAGPRRAHPRRGCRASPARDSAAAGPHPARPAGRGGLHGQAARARGRARRLHLQDPLARLRPRHVHHHQRHGGPGPAGGGHVPRRRPFEIFINSKNLEHYAWTVALTRMISAIFRRGGDVSFVVEELKAVFDPQGGQWMGGRYVPSLLAAIGGVIETHMIRTGFLTPPRQPGEEEASPEAKALAAGDRRDPTQPQTGRARACPRCGSQSLRRQEGCLVCGNCGYSKCG